MDADLEAILAESDSDDGLEGGGLSLEDILKEEGASSPLQEYRAPTTTEESYSARDWAVLQQILREDDDDDDVVEPPPPQESPSPRDEKPQAAPVGPVLWRGERLAPFALRERRLVAQNESIEASPLETKRRNRSKPVDLSRGSASSQEQKPSGALKVEQLKTASRQLAANARRPELGPGAPAALGASAKFVALGTSRGLALVFDHFQEVRRVLGTASTDAVKCVALEDDVACLGHASGVLVLWDVVKGSQLRRVDDAFAVSVEKVEFCCRGASDRAVAAIDASGVVNRIVFRQRVLGGSYLHEVECLLDAKSNVTPWLSVSSSYAAFSSTSASFVVAFAPSVRVAVTWPRPQSDVDNAVVSIDDDGILIRAWGCDLDALNSTEEGATVDFVPCTLPSVAVALCVVTRGVIILGVDDVLRLIDRKGRQLDAVSFHTDMIASSVDTVYALQGNELQQIEARSAQQRIASLVDAGEWLEALSSQVDAVSDDPSQVNNAIDLLRRYVALAVANAPARRAATRQLDLARSHFKMLASVCVEFCIAVDISEDLNLQAPFNLGPLVVCVRCCSRYAVEGIPRRSCPSLGRNQGRGAEIATRPLSLSEKWGTSS
jgi:hypothetical protein